MCTRTRRIVAAIVVAAASALSVAGVAVATPRTAHASVQADGHWCC